MIYNCTPHVINIFAPDQYSFDSQLRKAFLNDTNAQPKLSFEKSGVLLNIEMEIIDTDIYIDGINLKKQMIKAADSPAVLLPEFNANEDYVICSALYAQGCRTLGIAHYNLLNVSGVVYINPDRPAPVGCTDLILR